MIRDNSVSRGWDWNDDFMRDLERIWSVSKKDCVLWNRQSQMFGSFEKHGQTDSDLRVASDISYLEDKKRDEYLNSSILSGLTGLGLITDFRVSKNTVTYKYKNAQVRRCVLKCGNILEMYTYSLLNQIKETIAGYYDDIDIGVYVDWDGELHREGSSYDTINEVDIIVMRDSVPIFISCKNGDVKKEALYELDTVANHFGGAYVKKVLLTTYVSYDNVRKKYLLQRARDMNIDVIDNIDKMSRAKLIQTLKKRIK